MQVSSQNAARVLQVANDSKVVRAFLNSKNDLSEVYSPPRVAEEAKAAGLVAGFSLDLTVSDEKGRPWDFSKRSCRQRAWALVKEKRPYMLVGSPPCTPFSIIQNLNMRTKAGRIKVEEARKRGAVHLRFCVALYREQMRCGRYFVHEHPRSATSWEDPYIKALRNDPRTVLAEADLCQFGLMSRDKDGESFAKKPTTFLTNSLEMQKSLSKKCTSTHRHVHLMEGRASAAQVYPKGLCRAIVRGTRKQLRADRGNLVSMKCQDDESEVMAVEYEPETWKRYWDDMSGKELKADLVETAREEEIATVKKMHVWVKVDREQCFRETGRPPIKLRWVDVNKGDCSKPNYRSRIVAKEIKTHNRPDLFAATPPIENIKYLISRVASSQRGGRPTVLMVQDIKKAYFFAPATRRVFIELPPEESEPGRVGLLQKSLYGTRDAALNWTTAYTSALVDRMGFVQGKATPCAFYNEKLQVRTVVHGDDFVSEGPEQGLLIMDGMLRKEFEVKTEILGPEKRHVQELKILNRIVTWEKGGIAWEPDPRHAELIIGQGDDQELQASQQR